MAIYGYTSCGIACTPAADLTATNANQRYAARLDTTAANDLNGNPTATLTGTTATAIEVLGEYETYDNAAVRIKTGGVLILRASAAYAAANNGFGVVASATAGIVQVAATIGTGLGKIIGGGTENIGGSDVNVLRVLVE